MTKLACVFFFQYKTLNYTASKRGVAYDTYLETFAFRKQIQIFIQYTYLTNLKKANL